MNGKVSVTAQGIDAAKVDGKIVTLTPADNARNPLTYTGTSTVVNRWLCGGAGTTVSLNYLPGSCRGG